MCTVWSKKLSPYEAFTRIKKERTMGLQNKNEDFEWIKKYKRCHQESLNKLIKKYYRYSYKSFIYHGLPQKDAEDCTQDIWIRLARTLKHFNFNSSFKTFLDITIRHRVFDFIKSQYHKINIISLYIKLFGEGSELQLIDILTSYPFDDPETDHNYQTLVQVLEACIAKIKNRLEKKLVALWLDGYKRKDMADILGIPIGTVHGSLERGKLKIRNCVRENYC